MTSEYLEKVVTAITTLADYKGSSRQAILKYFKNELKIDDSKGVFAAIKAGVAEGKLTQNGSCYKVEVETTTPPTDPESHGAEKGDMLKVSYSGTLEDGTTFDTATEEEPFSFPLGVDDVIKGWDLGCLGMRVGEVRKLVVPPKLGYGKRKTAKIPPNSTLHFVIKLHELTRA